MSNNPSPAGRYQEAMRLHEHGECSDSCPFCRTGPITPPVRAKQEPLPIDAVRAVVKAEAT